ncbi:ATP-binding protein [Pseudomonas sp. MWU13-2105]|uniref:ATP-binding protein n=1 Tax=Pseudomonas sp. MWU13-2105 TaxID=2935074 RepID=UPI00200D18AA|nr:ATP-binding protein [Pseudomonas sp. MWU13-2105]
MSSQQAFFHRASQAQAYTKNILSTAIGSAASSGLFFAAPRRTGKSTFMREDLRPALEAAGTLVVYADLWENMSADPGSVILSAIRSELAKNEGVIQRLAKGAGMDKLKVGGLSFDLDRIGLGKDISLSAALAALSDETRKMIVLIIDEAQHAITTEAGVATMFALKAARDELNSSRHFGLRVVCTGSNSDKLAMLRNSKDQAFFGAPLIKFPPLGADYIEWFCANVALPFSLEPKSVLELFRQASSRPEVLAAAAGVLQYEFDLTDENGPARFAEEVLIQARDMNQELMRVVHSLTPIQSAVLRVMAAAGAAYAPFESQTMLLYAVALRAAGIAADVAKADIPGVQQALVALQDKKLVWRAARGVYAVEEQSVVAALEDEGLLQGLKSGRNES